MAHDSTYVKYKYNKLVHDDRSPNSGELRESDWAGARGHPPGAGPAQFLDLGTGDMNDCCLWKCIVCYVYFRNVYVTLQLKSNKLKLSGNKTNNLKIC